nr:flavin reductase family protein [Amycolatopsis sp.]
MAVDKPLFREIFAALPTTVAVLTTLDADSIPRGLTVNAICAVSASPPLLLACVDKTSDTLPALVASRVFVVNFLAAHAAESSRRFAGKGADKFAGLDFRPAARAGGAPILLDQVVAHAECVVHDVIEAGDHWLFLGRIEGGGVHSRAPLIYYRRAYAAWPPGDGRKGAPSPAAPFRPDGHAPVFTGPGNETEAATATSAAATITQ